MKQIKFIAFLAATVLLSVSVIAQQYSFRNYSVSEGVGSANINHIFQDKKGFIWLATQGGGVSKFDGKTFTTYTKQNGLIDNDVTYIAENSKGDKWIATASGVSLLKNNTFTNYNQKQGFTNSAVYSIYIAADDSIYFAAGNSGLFFFNGKHFHRITSKEQKNVVETFCLAEDNKGKLWAGTSEGIYILQQGYLEKFTLSNEATNETYFSCLNNKRGALFFGSTSGRFIKIDSLQKVTEIPLPSKCQNDFIGGIALDHNGYYWLATDHGLLKYKQGNFKLYSEKEGLSVDMVQTVMCDYEGNIWSGSLGGGVDVLTNEAFVSYNEKSGLYNKKVTDITFDQKNNLYYIATNNGLYFLNKTDKKIAPVDETLNLNIVSVAIDAESQLWLAALEGIYTLSKTQKGFILNEALLKSEQEKIISPTKIICTRNGEIWLTTFGSGLFKIQNNKAENLNRQYPLLSTKLLTVYEDHLNRIFIGAYDNGIGVIQNNAFKLIAENISVWSIAEGKQGQIFFGSGEKGLMTYNGTNIKTITSKEKKLPDNITSLAYDATRNYLWAGNESHLQLVQLSEKNEIEKLEVFNENNGFTPKGINQHAIYIDTLENSVWLGTVNGLWNFNYQYFRNENISPRLHLKDIRLFYQKTDWSKYAKSNKNELPQQLTLPYHKNHLTFDIQALTTRPVQYVFKLEGQDNVWSSPTTNQEITFSNIEPGRSYAFLAKAIDNEGNFSNDIIQYNFNIKPAWWNTWWFRLLMIVSVFSALIIYIKRREQILKTQNLKLEKTVQLRTQEIAQQKAVVEKTLEEKEVLLQEKEILLKEIHHRVKNNLQTISSILMLQSSGLKDEEAKKAIKESQSRVSSIALVHQKLYQNEGIEKVELNAFVKDLTVQIKSLFNRQKQQVTIHINIPETHLLIDIAIPLGLILNELLTNSYKYAFNEVENGEIIIELKELNSQATIKNMVLKYSDNGKGYAFSKEKPTTLGLRLIHVLSKQIGASLEYNNAKRSEYTFTFNLNI